MTRIDGPVTSVIDGVGIEVTGHAVVSENPARPDEPVGSYIPARPADVDRALASAARARAGWAGRSALDRAQVLRRCAVLLDSRTEEFAALLTAEEGKTLPDARGEVRRAVEILEYHASSAWWPSGETFHVSPGNLAYTMRVPLGVVAIITPWNFPMTIPVWKLAPALVHGNVVVWKPASATAVLSMRFAALVVEAGLDPGVLTVLLGDGNVGATIVGDARVDAVSFTGSEAIGRRVAVAAAVRGAKCQAELGGHNPAIVLADADIPLTVDSLVRSIANQTGQKCTAARRIIVDRSVVDAVINGLKASFDSLVVGDGTLPGVDVGPLVSRDAKRQVAGAIDVSLGQGCELIVGGARRDDDSAFLSPTLLFSVDQRPEITREEVFGPVSVLVPCRGVDDAFDQAADTRFGLSAALFTGSESVARRFARDLPVGLLNINRPTTSTELHMPFGGTKASSAPGPAEQGMSARDFYTDTRSVVSRSIP